MEMDRKTMNELVRRWRDNGDQNAATLVWKEVVDKIGLQVERHAKSLGIDEYEDILQETFIRLQRDVLSKNYDPEVKGPIGLHAWNIARDKLLEEFRKRKRRRKKDEEHPIRVPDKNDSKSIDIVLSLEEHKILAKAISELPEPEKEVFCSYKGFWPYKDRLVESHEMSFEEIGSKAGKGREWARGHYAKARFLLQRKLPKGMWQRIVDENKRNHDE